MQECFRTENWWYVWREICWGLRDYCFQVESCLYKCCSAYLQMFFLASGGAVLLVQTDFSSLLSCLWLQVEQSCWFRSSANKISAGYGILQEGEESQVQCVQENLKCSDFKAESERNTVSGWSHFSAKNFVSSEFWAAVNKSLCWLCWRRNQRCFDL